MPVTLMSGHFASVMNWYMRYRAFNTNPAIAIRWPIPAYDAANARAEVRAASPPRGGGRESPLLLLLTMPHCFALTDSARSLASGSTNLAGGGGWVIARARRARLVCNSGLHGSPENASAQRRTNEATTAQPKANEQLLLAMLAAVSGLLFLFPVFAAAPANCPGICQRGPSPSEDGRFLPAVRAAH